MYSATIVMSFNNICIFIALFPDARFVMRYCHTTMTGNVLTNIRIQKKNQKSKLCVQYAFFSLVVSIKKWNI